MKRNTIIWLSVLLGPPPVVFYLISQPSIGNMAPLVVETIGALLGVLMAIGFAELARIDLERHRAKKLNNTPL